MLNISTQLIIITTITITIIIIIIITIIIIICLSADARLLIIARTLRMAHAKGEMFYNR